MGGRPLVGAFWLEADCCLALLEPPPSCFFYRPGHMVCNGLFVPLLPPCIRCSMLLGVSDIGHRMSPIYDWRGVRILCGSDPSEPPCFPCCLQHLCPYATQTVSHRGPRPAWIRWPELPRETCQGRLATADLRSRLGQGVDAVLGQGLPDRFRTSVHVEGPDFILKG